MLFFQFLIAILKAMRNSKKRTLTEDREWGMVKEGPYGQQLWIERETGQSVMVDPFDNVLEKAHTDSILHR